MSEQGSVNSCCGEQPVIWWPYSGFDELEAKIHMEKIECQICGRIVYGSDRESIEIWDNGGDDR